MSNQTLWAEFAFAGFYTAPLLRLVHISLAKQHTENYFDRQIIHRSENLKKPRALTNAEIMQSVG